MPSGIVTTMPIISASDTSPNVFGSAPPRIVATGKEYNIDSPKSPRTSWTSQRTYCCHHGSLRPSCSRICSTNTGSGVAPTKLNFIATGSMGDSLINTNVPMVTTSKMPTILANRCNTNRYNTSPAFFYYKLAIFLFYQ